jgi:LVIVD repeat-containing protein
MTPSWLMVVALVGALIVPTSGVAEAKSGAGCGPGDLPEAGLQGDVPRADQESGRAARGYNCGLAMVGHNDLGARGGNANMAWAGHCAYVAGSGEGTVSGVGGSGVAVVDVSDPRHPKHVRTLKGPGSDATLETIHAMVTKDRAVLVAGRYGLQPFGDGRPAPMDIYDVRDCARPKLMSTLDWPSNTHNLTITADGKRVFSTLPLQAADISNLRSPRYLGNLDDQISTPTAPFKNISHEAWIRPDGKRLYIGGQVVGIGEYFTIADISNWPKSPPRIVSQFIGRGHSLRPATINGRSYLLHSEESIVDPAAKGCVPANLNPFAGASQPWLTDITDESHPVDASQFRLEINEPVNCAAQVASGVNASVHYHDLDDAQHTTFAMLSMWNAGLRVVDVRDPKHMREVAYFNPGQYGSSLDQAWGHVRYVPSTGHIWLTTQTGGFWVLELEPQVRRALGLPKARALSPRGRAPRPAGSATRLSLAANEADGADVTRYYCTLAFLAR